MWIDRIELVLPVDEEQVAVTLSYREHHGQREIARGIIQKVYGFEWQWLIQRGKRPHYGHLFCRQPLVSLIDEGHLIGGVVGLV